MSLISVRYLGDLTALSDCTHIGNKLFIQALEPGRRLSQNKRMRNLVRKFAGFTYSPQKGLFRDDAEIRLGPQARQLLELLLDADGGLVTREEISARLWTKRPPSDASIDRCVYLLRKPLRDAGFGDVVATDYGRGLSLRTKVEVVPSVPPALPVGLRKPAASPPKRPANPGRTPSSETKMIELTVGDIVVRVGHDVEEEQLARILRAARAARLESDSCDALPEAVSN